jgi:SAM-dependent methyltransferase
MFNRYWHVIDEDIRSPSSLRADFDFISCISVIEHIDDAAAAFRSMIALLIPGGHLVLTMPYNETKYVEDVYKLPGGDLGDPQDYCCACYNRAVLDQWLAEAPPARIVRQDYWQFWSGDVWRQGHRLTHSIRTAADRPHQLTCALIRRT